MEDSGADASKVELFRKSLGVTYPLFYDESKALVRTYAIAATSTTFIISPDFVVREKVEGGTGRGFLEYAWGLHGKSAP